VRADHAALPKTTGYLNANLRMAPVVMADLFRKAILS